MRGIASRDAATMYRSNAGARNVNALANTPNAGFAGCHWKGTVSSIRKAGRRTTRFVIGETVTHLCQYVKQMQERHRQPGW